MQQFKKYTPQKEEDNLAEEGATLLKFARKDSLLNIFENQVIPVGIKWGKANTKHKFKHFNHFSRRRTI